ncbi:MAG: DUF3798 domain-containing protein [Planctomycetes bacterium]|nr:DUF3798 domain-containing protein [Planctomycetota bacterium]
MRRSLRPIRFLALLGGALAFAGCGKPDSAPSTVAPPTKVEAPSAPSPVPPPVAILAAPAPAGPYKIGLVTGTVSQGEDEFRAAQKMAKKYPGVIAHVTYPDNFMNEQETTIAKVVELAHDPQVRAVIICQGVPGTIPAIQKAKEARPDCLFIVVEPHENPKDIAKNADLIFISNEMKRGRSIVGLAKKMGAKTFVHYSFPRHMSQEFLKSRADLMKSECETHGMTFAYVNAPDPMSDAGLPGAQQFILEDVPREVDRYGRDTAFFSTNCGMQEPLIRSALEEGAMFPEQCCPSPTHGYPGALGLKLEKDEAGDMTKIIAAIKAEIGKKGGAGRFATWQVPANMLLIEGCVELVRDACEAGQTSRAGFTKAVTDLKGVKSKLETICGKPVDLENYEGKTHYYLILIQSVIF